MLLDHIFALPRGLDPAQPLCKSTLAAADVFSARLAEAGFAEGSGRSHPGQGSANRRLFLHGLMIECLFVDDEAALDHPRGAPLALGGRFRDVGASGIGIAFRPGLCGSGALPAPWFRSRAYRPDYLPDDWRIDVASGLGPELPLLFHLPFAQGGIAEASADELRTHPNGASGVAGLMLEQPSALPDSTADVLGRAGGIECRAGAAVECLHVRLSGVDEGFDVDLRPLFGLRLHG